MCDRTQDFFKCVQSAGGQIDRLGKAGSRKVLDSSSSSSTKGKNQIFNEAASEIARGVHKTSAMLTKLTNLVRKQGLFDDPTEEINNLIFRIKQDLDELNTKCDGAQSFIDSKKSFFSDSNASHSSQHNSKVVGHLKADLMNTTKDFKSVLEMRSFKMKDQQQRKVELTGKGLLSPTNAFENANPYKTIAASSSSSSSAAAGSGQDADPSSTASNALTKRHAKKALPSPYANNDDISSNHRYTGNHMEDNQQEQQQLLLEPIGNSQYYEAREQAVTEVEKTIGELGTLFKRLATMISEQQELVERIDEDVENAMENTENAKNTLLKVYENVSSNRGMYMKLGAIFAAFILFFVLFMM